MAEHQLVIDVQKLSKSFDGKPAVIDLSLQVRKGEIFGFLGPNGSGKTTTIRMLCGLLVPDSGKGYCLGQNILTQTLEVKKQVGYMTQNFSLYKDLTIYENLDFIAHLYQVEKRKEMIDKILIESELKSRANQLVSTLSSGLKQRLSLSAALLHKPQLLLLDEPTAGIDPKARRDFWEQIHWLAEEEKITTLVSTHYMDEAERCHRLAYISQGRIVLSGTKEEIINQSGLVTWMVSGENLADLARELKEVSEVLQVVMFGDVLHVSGEDAKLLEQNLQPFQKKFHNWQLIQPSFEDVFIHLVPE